MSAEKRRIREKGTASISSPVPSSTTGHSDRQALVRQKGREVATVPILNFPRYRLRVPIVERAFPIVTRLGDLVDRRPHPSCARTRRTRAEMNRVHAPRLRGRRDVAGADPQEVVIRHRETVPDDQPALPVHLVPVLDDGMVGGVLELDMRSMLTRRALTSISVFPNGGFSCESVMPATVITSSSSASSNSVALNVPWAGARNRPVELHFAERIQEHDVARVREPHTISPSPLHRTRRPGYRR